MNWTIFWDMHRRPGRAGWSRAIESNEGEALVRADRFHKLGFVVYEIRDPKGVVVHDEGALRRRFAPAPAAKSPDEPPATPATILGFSF